MLGGGMFAVLSPHYAGPSPTETHLVHRQAERQILLCRFLHDSLRRFSRVRDRRGIFRPIGQAALRSRESSLGLHPAA